MLSQVCLRSRPPTCRAGSLPGSAAHCGAAKGQTLEGGGGAHGLHGVEGVRVSVTKILTTDSTVSDWRLQLVH